MNPKTLGIALLGAAALASCSSSSSGKKILTGAQTGTASVNLATAAATFAQPKQIKLSGTAVYDDGLDTVTLSLTITNKSKSVLHNAKVLVSGLSEGAVTADGSFGPAPAEGGGIEYIYYGPESIPPGGTAARDIEFTGVTGVGTDLTMDLEILVHPWIFVPGGSTGVVATDASGSGEEIALFDAEVEAFGWDGDSWHRVDAMSPDTRYVYYTNRNQPAIMTFDTVDQTFTMGDSLIGGTIAYDGTGALGCIDGLTPSPDGKLIYATVSHGVHIATFDGAYPVPTMVEVLKLDAQTLSVKDRVTVWTPPPVALGGEGVAVDIRGRRVSVTNDGKYGSVAITNASEVSLLNLGNMSVMDTYATTGLFPRHTAISPDASTIAVAYTWRDSSDGTLELIDTATGDLTDLVPDTLDAGTDTQGGFLEYGPDGRLYYGRAYSLSENLSIYDPVAMDWTEVAGSYLSIHFGEDAYCVYEENADEVHCYDYTDVEQTFPATGAAGISLSTSTFGHGLVITE